MGRASAKLEGVSKVFRLAIILCFFCVVFAQTAIHTVVQGDTLYALAQSYQTTIAELRRLNGLSTDTLAIGQQLYVPYTQTEPVGGKLEPEEARTDIAQHIVSTGETLAHLGERYNLSVDAIRGSNLQLEGVSQDTTLISGTSLLIPPTEGVVVRLENGTNILGVALEHDVSVANLALANGFYKASEIEDGQLIFVPEQTILEQIVAELRAVQEQSKSFIWPIGGKITSRFGYRNISVGGNTFHSGVDIAASIGTPIQASKGGTVTRSGWGGAYGYVVFIDHQDGTETRYAHMSNMAVAAGTQVSQGDVVGWVGSTGASTGPHLHFEIRVSGRAIDPFSYLELQ